MTNKCSELKLTSKSAASPTASGTRCMVICPMPEQSEESHVVSKHKKIRNQLRGLNLKLNRQHKKYNLFK